MAVYFIVSLSLSSVYCVTVLAMFARCWTPTALYCKDDVNSVSYTIEKEKYELRHHAPIQSNHKLERRRRRRRFRYAEDDEENRPTSCQRPRPLRFCGRRRGKKKKQINDARSIVDSLHSPKRGDWMEIVPCPALYFSVSLGLEASRRWFFYERQVDCTTLSRQSKSKSKY